MFPPLDNKTYIIFKYSLKKINFIKVQSSKLHFDGAFKAQDIFTSRFITKKMAI